MLRMVSLNRRFLYIGFLIILILYLSTNNNNNNKIEEFATGSYPNSLVDFETDKNLEKGIKKTKEKTEREKYIEYKQKTYATILKDTKDVLDKLKIPFFLSSGTCLGQFRENKFLDHDYDIDIGIFEEDYSDKIIEKMAENDLKLYRTLGDRKNGMELSFRKPNTRLGRYAKIDIFLHYPKEINGKRHYCWYTYKYPEFKEKIEYCVPEFNLEPVIFKELIVNVPFPTSQYIISHYGKDWKIPRRAGVDYFYATSPKSITSTG